MTNNEFLKELFEFLEKNREESTYAGFGGSQSEYDMGKESAYENVLDFLNERLAKN